MSKATQFRSLAYMLRCSGYNVWDARIEARKILGLRVPDRLNNKKPARESRVKGYLEPEKYPTLQDRWDTYHQATVATCKSVIDGTAVFRSLGDFARTWQDVIGVFPHHKPAVAKEHMSVARKKNAPTITVKQNHLINKMKIVLVANGMSELDATLEARKLLGIGGN